MLIVALTGGIGSGKSTVGELFQQLGAVVVDSDQLAREVVERGSLGFEQIVTLFGDEILKNGEINRSLLAEIIFKDPAKRKNLEQITHPLIRKAFADVVAKSGDQAIVINQIPLLVESKYEYNFDHVITVSTSEDKRIERLLAKGYTQEQIQNRMNSQVSDADREKIADSIIQNNESEKELLPQVEKIWEQLQFKLKSK
jgi:dephospho-CoA kinase